ncbi:MAG: ribose ABC transporter permease [Eubacteriales bacterium]|nr:ribose ABC transporter permease [Eubacteriales bacterium]
MRKSLRVEKALKPHAVILITLLVLITGMSIIAPNFMTVGNMIDIIRVNSIKGIMSVGMTCVLLTGGIDLSVGSTFAVAGAVTASFVSGSYSDYITSNLFKCNTFVAILIGLAAAAAIGLVNGLIIVKLKVEPFIATLAMMTFARGITYLYTGGYPINFKPIPDDFAWFGKGYFGILPVPALIFILVICLGGYLLKYTQYGRSLFAIGGNKEAAELSGIPVERNVCLTYIIMAVFAGIAGIIMTSRVASASAVAGESYEMDIIASVVLGGTVQSGGAGSITGTVIGVFIFGIIENGLNILGMPTYFKLLIKGIVIILALGGHFILPQKKAGEAGGNTDV